MYIAPNSEIRLLNNVPLDSKYANSFYFANITDQITYFTSKVKRTFSQQTYQRKDRGYIRLDASADDVFDCNYLMYRNTAYGNKWFYAFIDSIDYINNATCEVKFTIDPLMSWYFEMEVPPCYIVRQHTYNDAIGENIEPEPFDTGEYVFEDYSNLSVDLTTSFKYIILNADSEVQPTSSVQRYGNIISGVTMYVFKSEELQEIRQLLDRYLTNPDNIVAIYCVPSWLILDEQIASDHRYTGGGSYSYMTITKDAITENSNFGNYHPQNNKLYTYPYNYFHVDNGDGQSLSLRYEYFENHTPQLFVRGTIMTPVQVALNPLNYKGILTAPELQSPQGAYTETLSLNNYPQCCWNVDAFKAWLAQNSVPLLLGMGKSVGMALTSRSITSATRSMVSTVIDEAEDVYQASIQADVCKNSVDVGSLNCASGHQTFYCGRAHLHLNELKHIDSFFTAFGYSYNKVETPHLGAHREAFCYVKTKGCLVRGNLPNDDKVNIQNILNNGIRFWNKKTNVGDLAQSNAII